MNQSKTVGRVTLSLLLIGATLLTRKTTASAWSAVTKEPAPRDQSNRAVDMEDAIAWALVSGAAVGFARLLVRRGIGYEGSPLDN